MFRKPHAFVALMIGLIACTFTYVFFASPKTSHNAEFLLKGQKSSSPLSFVSVSEHKDKSTLLSTHRSDSKKSKEIKKEASLTDNNDQTTNKESNSGSSIAENQDSAPESLRKEEHHKEKEVTLPQEKHEESSESDENSIFLEDPSDTDIKENASPPSSDELPEKKRSYLEGLSKSDSAPSPYDQVTSPSIQETVEEEVEQRLVTSDKVTSFYSNPKDEPEIILVIEELGRRQETLELALDLPKEVTLAFHSFEGVEDVSSKIRSDGHETLLMLPMEPLDYPENDPGPTALLTGLDPSENVERLKVHLANLPSCNGVMPFLGSRFLVSKKDLQPIFKTLKEQNLFFIETFQTSKSLAPKAAKKESLSFQRIENRLDQALTQEAILKELAVLEEEAKREGQAFAVTRDVPMVLRLVAEWSKTLPEKKIRLAPLSSCFTKKNETS